MKQFNDIIKESETVSMDEVAKFMDELLSDLQAYIAGVNLRIENLKNQIRLQTNHLNSHRNFIKNELAKQEARIRMLEKMGVIETEEIDGGVNVK
jgi:hypothetical protein